MGEVETATPSSEMRSLKPTFVHPVNLCLRLTGCTPLAPRLPSCKACNAYVPTYVRVYALNAPRQAELTITNGYECKGPVRKANDISTERSAPLVQEKREGEETRLAREEQMDRKLDR